MAHKIAKLILEQAKTFLSRKEAVNAAIELGMPLEEIEAYLDWLDSLPDQTADSGDAPDTTDTNP